MQEEKARDVFEAIRDKLPEDKSRIVLGALREADDPVYDGIMCSRLYDPIHILLFSIFLGGFAVDRFMIGDIGLGVAKLLFGWLTCGIWNLIDIFFSYKACKEKNFRKVSEILSYYPHADKKPDL